MKRKKLMGIMMSAVLISGMMTGCEVKNDTQTATATQDILKDYDITMVNIWTTWCGYCRKEMPDIQKAYENFPENANIIAFCMDAAEETDIANAIVDKSGVKFTVIAPDENLSDKISPYITGFPTTILVDSNGKLWVVRGAVMILAVGFIVFGVIREEQLEVLKKATSICLQCIGIG